jgi:PAS domain S-box-containing protein
LWRGKVVLIYVAIMACWIVVVHWGLPTLLSTNALEIWSWALFIMLTGIAIFAFLTREDARNEAFQKALEEKEKKTQMAIKATGTGTWSWDILSNKTEWSEENYRLMGLEPYSIESSYDSWRARIHLGDLERVDEIVRSAVEEKKNFDFEYRAVWPDGTVRWIQDVGKMMFDGEGNPAGMYGIQIDITDRKLAEEELKERYQLVERIDKDLEQQIAARERAERQQQHLSEQLRHAQKMEAIGTLAGGIAHDFNNILTSMVGYAELAKEKSRRGRPIGVEFDQIIQAGNRAENLVKRILTYSRQSIIDRRPIEISAVVDEVVQLLRATIPGNMELKLNIDGDCGFAFGDPTEFHQVVMNLCANAFYAMRKNGGVLSISLSNVELRRAEETTDAMMLQPGAYIRLEVSDTGPGIDADILERIFDPYFTTKPMSEGTGMGLAVVHGIVKGMKGHIQARSSPGQGAVFEVHVPRIDAVDSVSRDSAPSQLPGGSERLLVVDDDEVIAGMQGRVLRELGYDVVAASSGPRALEMFKADPGAFDAVLTDISMPGMSGLVLSRHLRSMRSEIPIILCTGYSEMIDEKMAKSMGINELIMKPLFKGELAGTVRRVLDAGAP